MSILEVRPDLSWVIVVAGSSLGVALWLALKSDALALFETALDAMLLVGEDGKVKAINPQVSQWFGYSHSELLGQSVAMILPDWFTNLSQDALPGSAAGALPMTSRRFEIMGYCKDGRRLPLEVSLAVVATKWQRLRRFRRRAVLALLRDMSEQKRHENELVKTAFDLAQSNADLKHFAFVVSHDLKEPLIAIGNYLNLLQSEAGDRLPDDTRQLVEGAIGVSMRATHLIDDLLSNSRAMAANNLSLVDLNDIIQEAAGNLGKAISERQARIRVGRLPTVVGDSIQLVRLFQNLLSNSIKFQVDGRAPEITISHRVEGHHFVFTVSDNGIGFSSKEAREIFRMFKRLNNTYPGTGIGLATCKKVVENHRGTIWASSQPGRGSTFYFTLPM